MSKTHIDPCILHRSAPMSRMDLLPMTLPNRSGLYLKPPKKVRIATRPQQVGMMLNDIKKRTGQDLTPIYLNQYKNPPPVQKDLVDFNPYYDETPIIGSGGLIMRPTLSQQTYINIVSQLNLPAPVVSGGSTLTMIPDVIPATETIIVTDAPLPPVGGFNPDPAGMTEFQMPQAGGGLSGLQTPSPGGMTPSIEIDELEETRNLALERDRQLTLGNIDEGFGIFPPTRPTNNPKFPKPSQVMGSNITTFQEADRPVLTRPSFREKVFSRFTRAPPRVLPNTQITQAVFTENEQPVRYRV